MLRQGIKENLIGLNKDFRFRGLEQTRIETFSDAVFALAITLLVISTEVPESFEEMKGFIFDLIPFALCMALILYIWWEHFIFFIRFGFKSSQIVFLNGLLLFFVLFYVYPLKFLAKMLVAIYGNMFLQIIGVDTYTMQGVNEMIKAQEMPLLMIIYGLGAALIFMTLVLMYRYALRQKEVLELNKVEIFDARSSMQVLFIMGFVPIISALISMILYKYYWSAIISGFVYMLYPLLFMIYGKRREKLRFRITQFKQV